MDVEPDYSICSTNNYFLLNSKNFNVCLILNDSPNQTFCCSFLPASEECLKVNRNDGKGIPIAETKK